MATMENELKIALLQGEVQQAKRVSKVALALLESAREKIKSEKDTKKLLAWYDKQIGALKADIGG